MRKKDIKKNIISKKSFISSILLIGGVAAGLISSSIIAKANEAVLPTNRAIENEENEELSNFIVSINDINSEDELIDLVVENGSQILIDDETEKMYLAYVNDSNEIEIVEINENDLQEILQQNVSNINYYEDEEYDEDEGVLYEQDSYIPQEYWRGVPEPKSNIKRLDSEEGRQAIEDAKKFKKMNK